MVGVPDLAGIGEHTTFAIHHQRIGVPAVPKGKTGFQDVVGNGALGGYGAHGLARKGATIGSQAEARGALPSGSQPALRAESDGAARA